MTLTPMTQLQILQALGTMQGRGAALIPPVYHAPLLRELCARGDHGMTAAWLLAMLPGGTVPDGQQVRWHTLLAATGLAEVGA